MHLEAAHPNDAALRQELQLLLSADRSGHEAAGHDRPEARDREGAVDRQPGGASLRLLGVGRGRQLDQRAPQRIEAFAGLRRDRDDRRPLQKRASGQIPNVGSRDLDELRRGPVDLGHGDDSPGEAEHADDLEVLPRLGHDGFVRGDDQEHGLSASRSRQHVAHEALVARHVHERNAYLLPLRVRETEIDRDPAPLFLGQPIRVDSGQRFDQRGLSMIDVAGRADEKAIHGT